MSQMYIGNSRNRWRPRPFLCYGMNMNRQSILSVDRIERKRPGVETEQLLLSSSESQRQRRERSRSREPRAQATPPRQEGPLHS